MAGEFARDGLHGGAAQAVLREAGDGTVTDMPMHRVDAYTWRFVADLPPGSYVVAFFETAGEVTYGLLLDVQ